MTVIGILGLVLLAYCIGALVCLFILFWRAVSLLEEEREEEDPLAWFNSFIGKHAVVERAARLMVASPFFKTYLFPFFAVITILLPPEE